MFNEQSHMMSLNLNTFLIEEAKNDGLLYVLSCQSAVYDKTMTDLLM